jgi:hypothetical protein
MDKVKLLVTLAVAAFGLLSQVCMLLGYTRPAGDPTRFILIGTSHPGNVGATARAMKVMGFTTQFLSYTDHDDPYKHKMY